VIDVSDRKNGFLHIRVLWSSGFHDSVLASERSCCSKRQ
jgi:hypothetical protein